MTREDDSGSVTVQVRQPTPVTDPLELKAIAVREYTEKAARAGRATSAAAIERFAVQELNLVDAFGRLHQVRRSAERTPARGKLKRDKLRSGQGHRRYDTPALTRTTPVAMGEQVANAVARIGRILENDGGTKVADVDKALAATAVPKLAREFLELWWFYQTRHRLSRFNPFLGMSDGDASKRFLRGIFDICDRSTGVLGSWTR